MLLRYAIFFGFIALLYLTQRFWFIGAWHRIEAVSSPAQRSALQVAWFIALLLLVASFLDPLLGHVLS